MSCGVFWIMIRKIKLVRSLKMTLKNTIWYTNVCNEYIIRNKKAERSIHHPVSVIAVKIVKSPGNSYICGQFDSYGNVFSIYTKQNIRI